MRPHGRLCLATWQPLIANDWLLIPGTALLRYGSLPDADEGGPGMFAQSEPDIVKTGSSRRPATTRSPSSR